MNSMSSRLTNKILTRLSNEAVFPVSAYTIETLKTILKEELDEVTEAETHKKA